MSAVTIRPAGMADLEPLLDLITAVAAEGMWIGAEVIDRVERHAGFRAAIDGDDQLLLVAEAGGAIVGQLWMGYRRYGVADLGMLVADGWRRQGIGSALVQAGIDWARQAGAHKVALQVWPHNQAALALYRKFGFVEEGVLRRHYRRRNGERWDAVVMGLPLEE